MGRTNVVLNDDLLEEAITLSHCRTKRELVNLALREFIKSLKQKLLLQYHGSKCWEGNLRKMRRRRY